jgi:hypothetical protein
MLNRAAIVPILWLPLFYDQTRFSGMPAVPFACGQSWAQSLRWASATSSISRRPLAFSARFQDLATIGFVGEANANSGQEQDSLIGAEISLIA